MNLDVLKSEIELKLNSCKGNFAIVFQDQSDKLNSIMINEKKEFHPASTIKISIMMELFRKASQGRVDLESEIPIKNRFPSLIEGNFFSIDISDEAEEDLRNKIGERIKLAELIELMITRSSNLAANILIELLDLKELSLFLRSIGIKQMTLNRGFEDIPAFEKGFNNTTTAFDLYKLIEYITTGDSWGEAVTAQMRNILLNQKINLMIPAGLPPNLKVAHKTGSISNLEHDAGVVYLSDKRSYILVILTEKLESNEHGLKLGAEISRLIYRHYTGKA